MVGLTAMKQAPLQMVFTRWVERGVNKLNKNEIYHKFNYLLGNPKMKEMDLWLTIGW